MSTTTTPSKPASFEMPPPSAEHTATQNVATRLTALVSAGKNEDAVKELYADNVRHLEVMGGPGCDRITEGKASILEKAAHWAKTTTIHSASCGKAIINGVTRARQGMVIVVPEGNDEDATRLASHYDATFEYLRSLGLQEVE